MLMYENSRRANVVWSFDSSCLKEELIPQIYAENVDALRLVSESGEMDAIATFIKRLRNHPDNKTRPVPIMVDLMARFRGLVIGLAQPREVNFGEQIKISQPGDGGEVFIQTGEWATLFKHDCPVFVGSGSVMLMPRDVGGKVATMEVIQGGTIYPEAEIHVPGTKPKIKFEDLDVRDLKSLLACDVDYLIAPGFDDPSDLAKLHREIATVGPDRAPWVILNVGSTAVFKNLEFLLPLVRGVLVSRVSMAMTTDPAHVPMLTKEIIQVCNRSAKLVLVASEMLGSMRHNVTPTRAEVSDIANAILDGADGVVLSEDLPYGRYARRGLNIARRAIEEIESQEQQHNLNWEKNRPDVDDELSAVTFAAYRTAIRNKAKAIVCITKSGNTALHLSSFRTYIPTIAITQNPAVVRKLTLVRGVDGVCIKEFQNIDQVLPLINETLTRDSWLRSGDKIVFVSVTISSIGNEASNLFTVQTLQ